MDPLVAIAVAVVGGISLAAMSGPPPLALLIALMAMGAGSALALVARGSSARPRRWLVVAVAILAGAAASASVVVAERGADPAGLARMCGSVMDVRSRFARDDLIVAVEEASPIEGGHAPAPGSRVRIRIHERDHPLVGSAEGTRWCGTVALSPILELRNPSPHPPWPAIDPVRVDARLVALDRAPSAPSLLGRARSAVRRALDATLEAPARGVARALVLGDLALDEESARDVRGAGLSHVLAVSGMHVTLLVGSIVWLLARGIARVPAIAARIPATQLAAWIGVPLVLAYAPFAGGAPSAWRAALTGAIAWTLEGSGRRPRAMQVTAASVLLFAMIDPPSVARPGFLLSIAATAALLVPIERAQERPLRAMLITCLRAMVATAPLVLWCFSGVPLIGLAANVIVAPLAGVVLLPVAALHALIALALPGLSLPSALLLDALARAFLTACEVLASCELGAALPPLDVAQGLVIAAACTVLVLSRSPIRIAIAIALGALGLAGAEVHLRLREQPRDQVRVTFLDVAQGDGALIDLPDGRLMLVDAGGLVGSSIDPGAVVIAPLLQARRRERIDVAVITHPHPDHYGGLAALLAAFEIGEIWDSGQAEDEEPEGEHARVLGTARAAGVPVRGPPELCDHEHAFGAARIEVVWPCPRFDPGWDANDNSIVLRLRIGRRSFLLAGDLEEHGERALAPTLSAADVLKVAHHGSRTSSTPPLLRALRPAISIVSAGRGNRFGHPHPEVVDRLEATGTALFRTDVEGGVIVTTDGAELMARAWSGREVRLAR